MDEQEQRDQEETKGLIDAWLKPSREHRVNVQCECGKRDWTFEMREDGSRWLQCEHCNKKRYLGDL